MSIDSAKPMKNETETMSNVMDSPKPVKNAQNAAKTMNNRLTKTCEKCSKWNKNHEHTEPC